MAITIGAGGDYPLALVQGAKYRRGFRSKVDGTPVNLTGYTWAAQIRKKESPSSDLVLDLTPRMVRDSTDPTVLNLFLPASVTRGLVIPKAGAFWDLFIWPTGQPDEADLLLQGAVTFDRAATSVPEED